MTSLDDILVRLEAVALLKRMKRRYKYKEMEKLLGLEVSLLGKYVKGRLIPGRKRAENLLRKTKEIIDIQREIVESLSPSIYNYPELTNLSATAPDLLLYLAIRSYRIYRDRDITKLLSIEGGGLILASLLATLLDKGLVYALRDHYTSDAIIEPYPPTGGMLKYRKFVALPKKALNPRDKVLIVDDIAWTGNTIKILLKYTSQGQFSGDEVLDFTDT